MSGVSKIYLTDVKSAATMPLACSNEIIVFIYSADNILQKANIKLGKQDE